MAKCDRTGKRKTREQQNARKFELGYYLVVTDTEATERYYFEGLQKSLPDEVKEKLHIEVIPKIKTWDLVRRKGIRAGWSNPCFEIWLYAYFGEIPEFEESTDCCARFGRTYQTKTGRKYSKSDEKLYTIMCDKGNEDNAIKLTERKYNAFRTLMITTPSKMTSCSSVFLLVQEIQEKVNQ